MKSEFTNGIRNEEEKQHENEGSFYNEQKQRRNVLSKKKILTLALCCALVGAAGETVAASAMEEIGEISNTGLSDEDAYIGITVTDLTVAEAAASGLSEGAVVQDVIEDSPAEEAGLEAGDIITEVDGTDIADTSDLTSVIRSASAGDEMIFTVYRDGETLDLTVNVGTQGSEETEKSAAGKESDSEISDGNPYIGVTVTDITVTEAAASGLTEGAVVQSVADDSPAEEAGLEAGDIITEADGSGITDTSDLENVIQSTAVGDEIVLTVYRDGETLNLTVSVGSQDSGDTEETEGDTAFGSEELEGNPYIGIAVTDITVTEAAASGLTEDAVVQSVTEDSPAEEAGLESGDIITEADGKEITGSSDLVSVIRSSSVGDEVVLTVYRDGETLELTVTVGADSSSESSASENIGNPYSANNNNRAYHGYHSEDGFEDDEAFSSEEEGNYSNGFLNSQGVSRSADDSL